MPRINFTDTALARLPSAQTGTDWYSDTRTEGLQLAVGKRKRTFYITKSLRNRQIRMKVGEWPLIPTEGARKKARILLGEISSGVDPRRSSNDEESLTVQQALNRYIAARTGARKRQKQITDGTAQNYRDLFKCHARRWLSRDIRSITADEVAEKHERMVNQASAANKLVRVFRSIQREFGITPPPKFNFYEENRKENGVKPVDRATFGRVAARRLAARHLHGHPEEHAAHARMGAHRFPSADSLHRQDEEPARADLAVVAAGDCGPALSRRAAPEVGAPVI
jgi:hypothetical protein